MSGNSVARHRRVSSHLPATWQLQVRRSGLIHWLQQTGSRSVVPTVCTRSGSRRSVPYPSWPVSRRCLGSRRGCPHTEPKIYGRSLDVGSDHAWPPHRHPCTQAPDTRCTSCTAPSPGKTDNALTVLASTSSPLARSNPANWNSPLMFASFTDEFID